MLPRERRLQRKNASASNAARIATPATVPPTIAPVRLTPPLLAPLVDGASVPVGEEVEEEVDDPAVDDFCDEVVPVVDFELDVFEVCWVDERDPDVVVLVSEVLQLAVGDSFEVDTESVLAVKDTVTLCSVTSEVRPVALLATVAARSLAVPQPY